MLGGSLAYEGDSWEPFTVSACVTGLGSAPAFCSDILRLEEQVVRRVSLWTMCCTQLRKSDGWLCKVGDAPPLGSFAGLSPMHFTL